MYQKVINFQAHKAPDLVVSPVSIGKQELVVPYNKAVSLNQEAISCQEHDFSVAESKFNEADAIFQAYQKCIAGFFPELSLAWDLSLIKNKMDFFKANRSNNNLYIQTYDAPIEGLLKKYEEALVEYAGTPYDYSYGLLACKRDTVFLESSLRYFFWGLPALKNIADPDVTPPIVQDFYTAVIENDMAKHGQNKWEVLQLYKNRNQYLFYFLAKLYKG